MEGRKLRKAVLKVGSREISKLKNLLSVLRKGRMPLADIHFDVKDPPDFSLLRPLLYHLINRYEHKTSIMFFNLPYCILPDGEEHVINPPAEGKSKRAVCGQCRFDAFCAGFPDKSKEEAMPVPDVPKEVSIELTTKCNMRCGFCFSKDAYDGEHSLVKEQVMSVLNQAQAMGASRVRFTGGEPVLDARLAEYAGYAKGLGLGVWLNTNGYDVGRYSAELIRNFDSVLVPLHGIRSEPGITGRPGSLRRKLETIRKIKLARPGIRLRAGTVISGKTLDELDKVHDMAKSLKVEWELYRMISDAHGMNKPRDFTRLYDALLAIYGREGKRFFVTNAFPFCFFDDPDKARLFSLGGFLDDGRSQLVVGADGKVKMTYYSPDAHGSWKDLARGWGSAGMRKMRSLAFLPRACEGCKYRTVCRGGSRTLAKRINGSYYDNDPIKPFKARGVA